MEITTGCVSKLHLLLLHECLCFLFSFLFNFLHLKIDYVLHCRAFFFPQSKTDQMNANVQENKPKRTRG